MIDNVQISLRSDLPLVVLSFFQQMPGIEGQRTEMFRGITSAEHGKKIADLLCKTLDYYPNRPKAAVK